MEEAVFREAFNPANHPISRQRLFYDILMTALYNYGLTGDNRQEEDAVMNEFYEKVNYNPPSGISVSFEDRSRAAKRAFKSLYIKIFQPGADNNISSFLSMLDEKYPDQPLRPVYPYNEVDQEEDYPKKAGSRKRKRKKRTKTKRRKPISKRKK
jgi:hypothetical protein